MPYIDRSWVRKPNGEVVESTQDPSSKEFYKSTVFRHDFNEHFRQYLLRQDPGIKNYFMRNPYTNASISKYNQSGEFLTENATDTYWDMGDCDGEKVYIPNANGSYRITALMKEDLTVAWSVDVRDWIKRIIVHSNGYLYVAFEYDGIAVCFDPSDGSIVWDNTDQGGSGDIWSGNAHRMIEEGPDGYVYSGGSPGYIYKSDPNDGSLSVFADLYGLSDSPGNAYMIGFIGTEWYLWEGNDIYAYNWSGGLFAKNSTDSAGIGLYTSGGNVIVIGSVFEGYDGIALLDPTTLDRKDLIDFRNRYSPDSGSSASFQDKDGIIHVVSVDTNSSPNRQDVISVDSNLNVVNEFHMTDNDMYGSDWLVVG